MPCPTSVVAPWAKPPAWVRPAGVDLLGLSTLFWVRPVGGLALHSGGDTWVDLLGSTCWGYGPPLGLSTPAWVDLFKSDLLRSTCLGYGPPAWTESPAWADLLQLRPAGGLAPHSGGDAWVDQRGSDLFVDPLGLGRRGRGGLRPGPSGGFRSPSGPVRPRRPGCRPPRALGRAPGQTRGPPRGGCRRH